MILLIYFQFLFVCSIDDITIAFFISTVNT